MKVFRHVRACCLSATKNMKLKQKFLLYYLLGIIIPVVAVDAIIIGKIHILQKNDQRQEMEKSVDIVLQELQSVVGLATQFSHNIIYDTDLTKILSSEYQSDLSFAEDYSYLEKSFSLDSYQFIKEISNVTVYTDNPTIPETEHIKQLNDVTRKMWWYQKYMREESDFICFEDITRNAGSGINPYSGTICYIQRFKNITKQECILVLDLNYDRIYHMMLVGMRDSDIYICNGNRILFASNSAIFRDAGLQAPVVEMIQNKRLIMKQKIPAISEGWECYAVKAKMPFWKTVVSSKQLTFLSILISLLLPIIVINMLVNNVLSRVHILEHHFDGLLNERLEKIPIVENTDEIGRLFEHYNGCVDKIEELIKTVVQKNNEKHALEVTKKQAELNALNTQVNPHFMYNTLQCICMRSLIKGEKETAEIVRCLSDLLRQMSKWNNDVVTIEEELSFVEKYLSIQKYRFAEKIAYEVRMEDNVKELLIPKLTLVSFVENACVHGIEESLENGDVSVTAKADEKVLIIVIKDTGCGMDDDTLHELIHKIEVADVNMLLHSKSTGVLNAVMRLKMYFGDKLSFKISSVVNEGMRIEISIQRDIR